MSDPEARHAGVDLQVDVDRSVDGADPDEPREALDLREIVDDRDEPAREHLGVRAAVVAPHHQDGRADARLAQLDPLLEERDAEPVRPRALERARDRGGAVSVAVGLEHRPDARIAGVALQRCAGCGGARRG